jgi:hypothetical protein
MNLAHVKRLELDLLMPLNLNQPYEASVEMVSYRRLYGLDALDCDHWQGYVQMSLFKLHVQVFAPKIEKIKGSVCLLHGYLEHSGI